MLSYKRFKRPPLFASLLFGLALAATTTSLPSQAAAQSLDETIADAIGIPQMAAFLPDKYDVAESDALPIDGVWMISTIRKKIRIEKGRAYAVDPWLHMFTLKVQRDMVVLQNFDRVGPGEYTADDLPLLGPATFRLLPNGNMKVTVQGILGPARYTLVKRKYDNESNLQAELLAMKNGDPVVAPSPPPVTTPPVTTPPVTTPPVTTPVEDEETDPLANCIRLDIDSGSGNIICLD